MFTESDDCQFSFVVFLLMFCLLVLPYYVVNKDEYNCVQELSVMLKLIGIFGVVSFL